MVVRSACRPRGRIPLGQEPQGLNSIGPDWGCHGSADLQRSKYLNRYDIINSNINTSGGKEYNLLTFYLVGGVQPVCKLCSSNRIISPIRVLAIPTPGWWFQPKPETHLHQNLGDAQLGLKRHPGILRLFDNLPFSFSCLVSSHTELTCFKNGIFRRHTPRWLSNIDVFWIDVLILWERTTGWQENMCNSNITTSRRVLDDWLIRIPFTAQYSILIPKSLKQILLVFPLQLKTKPH